MFCNGRFCEQSKSKNDYKSWACGKLGFVIVWYWGLGCSLNQRKVGRGAFLLFGVEGVLGQLYIKYGTLIEILFNIEHMSCFIKKKRVTNHTYVEKYNSAPRFNFGFINYHQHQKVVT
jgi:hypothetical protein